MPLNSPDKAPQTPSRGTRIMVFVILALIAACPVLWMFGAINPVLKPLSPLVCPHGSQLTTRFKSLQYDYQSGRKDTTKVNFDCVAPSGNSVENNADIILFSACGGPFIGIMAWGFIGSFFRKKKTRLELPSRRKRP